MTLSVTLVGADYWAATMVTEVRRAAVSCGDVVGHVTVSPVVLVVQV